MRIVDLIENTEGVHGCACAHGLSFYIETENHKLLSDLGPSEETLSNAERLGIDLRKVDTVVLSHGHYDHSGGIMPFSRLNPTAKIYMQEAAAGNYYADDGEGAGDARFRYIGIDPEIPKLPQVVTVRGDVTLDGELSLFTVGHMNHEIPFTNRRLLVRKEEGYERDPFLHEQYLVIKDGSMHVLVSGCAHNGILNIMEAFVRMYEKAPELVISGFHLSTKAGYTDGQRQMIADMAEELTKYPSRFITCHCTGLEAYGIMKKVMGDRLQYVHSGEEIIL